MTPLSVERATLRAWPARETDERGGWFHLAAGGVTGRVNACWPLTWHGGDIDAAIDGVEAWYGARGLAPRFKLTDGAFAPGDLPVTLARRGYASTMHTLIMTRSLSRSPDAALRRAGAQVSTGDGGASGTLDPGSHASRAPGERGEVALSSEMPPAFDQALRESTPDGDELEERRAIALRAPAPAAFAVRGDAGGPLAVGMSAVAGDLAGIFLMRTVPNARRHGHAIHVLRALLAWAGAHGAANAFLQVDAGNAPAVTLYEREGFGTLTSYCFWRKTV